MKTIKTAIIALGAMLLLAACNKDADGAYFDALVTVKEDASGTCFLQLDDKTVLVPSNMKKNLFNKEVRAIASIYSETGVLENNSNVKVMYMDSVLTKKLAPSVENNNDYYGNDPVEIYNDWLTVAEDGYVTIHFATNGTFNPYQTHWLNLVRGEDPLKPNDLVFHHKVDGATTPVPVNGVVAFNIREILPPVDEEFPITIHFESFSGPKSFTLKVQAKSEK